MNIWILNFSISQNPMEGVWGQLYPHCGTFPRFSDLKNNLIDLVEFLKYYPPSSGYHCVQMHLDLAGQNRAIMWSGSLCNSRIFPIGIDQSKFKTLPGSQTWALRNGGQQYQSANARLSEIRPGFSSGNTSSTHWGRRWRLVLNSLIIPGTRAQMAPG